MTVEMSGIVVIPFGADKTAALTKDLETQLPLLGVDANQPVAIQEGAIRGIDLKLETAPAAGLTVKIYAGATALKTKLMGTGQTWLERFDKEGMEVEQADALKVTVTDTSTTPTAINNVTALLYLQLGRSEL